MAKKVEPIDPAEVKKAALRVEALMLGLQPGVGLRAASERLGVDLTELMAWYQTAKTTGMLGVFKGVGAGRLADAYEAVARASLAHLTPEKLVVASARDIMAVTDLAVKNMQLLRGQATSRAETVSTTEDLGLKVKQFATDKGITIAEAKEELKRLLNDSAAQAMVDGLMLEEEPEGVVDFGELASEAKQ